MCAIAAQPVYPLEQHCVELHVYICKSILSNIVSLNQTHRHI